MLLISSYEALRVLAGKSEQQEFCPVCKTPHLFPMNQRVVQTRRRLRGEGEEISFIEVILNSQGRCFLLGKSMVSRRSPKTMNLYVPRAGKKSKRMFRLACPQSISQRGLSIWNIA